MIARNALQVALAAATTALLIAGSAAAQDVQPSSSSAPPDTRKVKPTAEQPDAKTRPTAKAPKDAKDQTTTVQGITVTADQAPVRSDIDRRSYDLSKDLQTRNGASVADALRNVPSVDVDLDGNVSLRGQSGVTIMIDGKPAPLFSGPGGGQALLQLPADQYDRVEVMTNPSAAFTPNGSAGIINLISKKRRPMGSFGSVRAAAADADKYRGGINGSIRNGDLTVALAAAVGTNPEPGTSNSVTRSYSPAGALLDTDAVHGASSDANRFEFGLGTVAWQARPNTQITFDLHAFHFEGRLRAQSDIALTDGTGALVDDLHQTLTQAFNGDGAHGGLKWRQDFAGDDHNLTVSLTRDRFDFSGVQAFEDVMLTPPSPDSFNRLDQRNINNDTEFSGDYTRPMPGDGKLKAGWDIRQEDDTTDSDGVLAAASAGAPDDPGQTDHYRFKRTVSAGYVTYQYPIGKLTVLGGLRLEDEILDIDDTTAATAVRSSDVHLYPTLHLSYAVNDNQQFLFNYSERIQRPDARSFNPFVDVTGPFSANQGNPHLKPQQTQDFETSWQTRTGGQFYIATLYYKQNTGGLTSITTDTGGGFLLTTQENLTRSKDAGLELVASGRLPHGFSYNLSGNVYWNEIDGAALAFTETRSDTTRAGRGTINWQADPKDYLQVNLSVAGRTLMPQGYAERGPQMNFGYQRKLTDKLMLVATVQNALDTASYKTVYDSPTLRGFSNRENHNRAVFLGVSFTFGAAPKGRQQQPDFDFGDQPGPGGPPH
jgi:outer membrane receptor protein involved in Fe transport